MSAKAWILYFGWLWCPSSNMRALSSRTFLEVSRCIEFRNRAMKARALDLRDLSRLCQGGDPQAMAAKKRVDARRAWGKRIQSS